MTRFVPVAVLLVVLAAGGVARAQTGSGSSSGSLPSGATIDFEKREIWDPVKKQFFQPQAASTDLFHYFNLAHCNCAQAHAAFALDQTTTDHTGNFRYLVHQSGPSGLTSSTSADYWVGTSCDDDTTRNTTTSTTCVKIGSTANIDTILTPSGETREFNLYQVINANDTTDACQQSNSVSALIYAFVRFPTSQLNTYDYKISQTAGLQSTDSGNAAGVDTLPPPVPANLTARSNEGEVDIAWSPPAAGTTDIAYYQALCSMADGLTHVFPSRTSNPQYVTTQATCPAAGLDVPTYEVPTETSLDNGEDPAVLVDGSAFKALDASFICAEVNAGTATSLQIKHLQNDVPYQVILVAVDLHGNFTALHFDHTITPHLVTDFWEDLHDKGGQAQGGLCLLAETYGDDSTLTGALRSFRDDTLGGSRAGRWLGRAYYATLARLGAYVHGSLALRVAAAVVLAPLVALALLWHWLGLPAMLGLLATAWWLRRRRRTARGGTPARPRRWLGAGATVALIVVAAAPAPAHAGNGGYQPYWEDTDPTRQSEQEQVPPGDPSLVNWHAGLRVGPYTPDIDNQVNMHPGPFEKMFGTTQHLMTMLDLDYILWTGFGQIGVGGSIGYWQKTAEAFSTAGGVTTTMRSSAHNALRLIPFALTATYRFTWLDDMYGIPVVPYIRGGLAYYAWWVSINDHFARLCDAAGNNCINRALGASLGLQGSIGLSIRAERIDASAAMSMRESGIQHAGVYGELSLATVDGFGSDKKLAVGDKTWFAGVEFEF